MKRFALAAALVILISPLLALAQASVISQIVGDKAATEKLYFSLRFGMNAGTLTGVPDAERIGGFTFGLTATIKLTSRLSLGPEFVPFSRKGVTGIPFVTTGDPALDPYFVEPKRSALVMNYIDIPVLVTYRLGRFNVGAGPFVAFLGSADERFRAELETGEEMLHMQDVSTAYRSLDYGLVFEASWTMSRPRPGQGLSFHLRYQTGFADVAKDPALSSPVRTSVLQFFLSFPFIKSERP